MRRSLIILASAVLACLAGCRGDQAVEEYKARWIRLRHQPVEEARVGTDIPVRAEIEVPEDVTGVEIFVFYGADAEPNQVVRMKPLEEGSYFASIPSHKRGTLITYYIEARAGSDLAVRVPGEAAGKGFEFYYKGIPNRPLLIAHIILMVVSLALLLLAGYLAHRAIKAPRTAIHVPRLAFLGAVVFFISSFPLGMIVAYQTYGKPWTGFPVGTDITDNKSLAIVIYWAVATFFYRGSVFKKDPSTDVLPMRPLPYIYLVGVFLTVVLFLIPH